MNETAATSFDKYNDIDSELGFKRVELDTPVEEWVDNVTVNEKDLEPVDIETLRYAATMLYMTVSRGTVHHIPDETEANRTVIDMINVFNNMRERLMNTKGKEILAEANIIKLADFNPFTPALAIDEQLDEHQRELQTDKLIENIRKNLEALVAIDVIHGDMFLENAQHSEQLHPRGSIYDADQARFLRIDGHDLKRAINAEATHKKFKHRFIIAGGPDPKQEQIVQILSALKNKYGKDNFCVMNTAITDTDEVTLNASIELNININTVNISKENTERIDFLTKNKQFEKAKHLTSIVDTGIEARKHETSLIRTLQKDMQYHFNTYKSVFNSTGPAKKEQGAPFIHMTDPDYYKPADTEPYENTVINYIRNTDIMLTNFNITGCVMTDHSFQANMIKTRAQQHNIPTWDLSEKEQEQDTDTPHEADYEYIM